MKLIIVTRKADDSKIYVNPEHIAAVFTHFLFSDTTVIQFPGDAKNNIYVVESADAVANMIEKQQRW